MLGRYKPPIIVTPSSPRDSALHTAHDFPLSADETEVLVHAALEEDEAFTDVTTIATVLSNRRARGSIVARTKGVVAGIPLAIAAFQIMDSRMTIRADLADGSAVRGNAPILFLNGHARSILSAERVALNFLQRLSGIATLTRRYVDAVKGTGVRIMDTRKTTPGWRVLEKYAVRAGGGANHRMGLGSAVLIKDNHLVAVDGDIAKAVKRTRKHVEPGMLVEVECEDADQVRAAVDAGADVIMLDNMSGRLLASCVKIAKGHAIIEASGGITLENVRTVAESGVEWISIGALTHSAPSLDLGLDFDPA